MSGTTKFYLSGADTVTISASAADKLIHSGNGDSSLLYLLVLRRGGELSVEECTGAIGRTEYETEAAFRVLEKLGLVHGEGSAPAAGPEQEQRTYTAEDARRASGDGSPFAQLVDEVQQMLGKVLTPDDLTRLFGIYDSLSLPPEVMIHLVSYCIGETRRKNGEGRMPTMRYIEKAAYTWDREGINTLELAEDHIRDMESRRTAAAEIQRVLQITGRSPSATEKRYINGWIAMGYGPDEISLAYDRTVVNTGRLTWAYMNSIIENWNAQGLKTVDDIMRGDSRVPADKRRKGKKEPAKRAAKEGVSAEEMDNMRKFLDRMREGE